LDPDPESQNLADPTNPDPDPKHDADPRKMKDTSKNFCSEICLLNI